MNIDVEDDSYNMLIAMMMTSESEIHLLNKTIKKRTINCALRAESANEAVYIIMSTSWFLTKIVVTHAPSDSCN